MKAPATVYLGLGSNLGDREALLRNALKCLAKEVTIELVSSLYETAPQGFQEQPWFLNAAVKGRTKLEPLALLHLAKDVEYALGRTPTFPNGPRPIDIDLLLYGVLILDSPHLTLPHPRLHERAFVLVPLSEIAAEVEHPLLHRSIGEMALGAKGEVRLWKKNWFMKTGG